MNILDDFRLQKTEIKQGYKRLLLVFAVQLSTISVLIILWVMSQNVVSIFDQYYHEKISDFYNVTIENIEYPDIAFLSEKGYFNMYIFMPDFEEQALYYNNRAIDYSDINLICDEDTLSESKILNGREYCENDNISGNYAAWISEEIAKENSIATGDVIEYQISEDKSLLFTVAGIVSGVDAGDIFVPFNTFLSDPMVKDLNIKFCLSAQVDSIVNYDSIKYRFGSQNKYMYFDELDHIFSLLFFIKSIFIGLSLIGAILCFVSIANICALHISGRKSYINMLYQLGMSSGKIKGLYSGVYLYNTILSVVLSNCIAEWYFSYFNNIINREFGNIHIETKNVLTISIALLIIFWGVTRVIICKSFKSIITVERD